MEKNVQKCNKLIYNIQMDKEFDAINNPNCIINPINCFTEKIIVLFNDTIGPGII